MELEVAISRLARAAEQGDLAGYAEATTALGETVQEPEGLARMNAWTKQVYGEAAAASLDHHHEEAVELWGPLEAVQRALFWGSGNFLLILRWLARSYRALGRPELAQVYAEEALDVAEELEAGRMHVAEAATMLRALAFDQDDYELALAYGKGIHELLDAEEDPTEAIAANMSAIGMAENALGRPDESIRWYRAALDLLVRRGGAPSTQLDVVTNLVKALRERGDYGGAEAAGRSLLHLEPKHRSDLDAMIRLRVELILVQHFRNLPSADPDEMRALVEQWREHRFDRRSLARMLQIYGSMLVDFGRHAEAEPVLEDALRVYREVAPDSNGEAVVLRTFLISCGTRERLSDEDYRRGRRWGRAALRIERRLAPAGAHRASTLGYLGVLERRRGRFRRAETLARYTIGFYERFYPLSNELLTAYRPLAMNLEAQGDFERLLPLFTEVRGVGNRILAASADERDRLCIVDDIYDFTRMEVSAQVSRNDPATAFRALDEGRGQSLRSSLQRLRHDPEGEELVRRIRENASASASDSPSARLARAEERGRLMEALGDWISRAS